MREAIQGYDYVNDKGECVTVVDKPIPAFAKGKLEWTAEQIRRYELAYRRYLLNEKR